MKHTLMRYIVLAAMSVGLLSVLVAGPVLAKGETYTLVGENLVVSGPNLKSMGASGNSAQLTQDEHDPGSYSSQGGFAVSEAYCADKLGQLIVGVSGDTAKPAGASCLDPGMAVGNAMASLEWDDNVPLTKPTEPPTKEDDPRIKNKESYAFDVEASKDGEHITACNGLFYQFATSGCLDFAIDKSVSGSFIAWDINMRPSIPGVCDGVAEDNRDYHFVIQTPSDRELEGGNMPARIFNSAFAGNGCGLNIKGMGQSYEDGLAITIADADKLDSLIGGPVETETEEDAQSLCQVEGGLGWILCPVMNTVASINDEAFGLIENFLVIPPMMTGSGASNAYAVWQAIRNIANVLFAFAFIIIVYSQLTSAGISNYGIKKMLPKMIVGVILVNASYWIVALSIDLSNVVGSSIYEVMRSFGGDPEVGGAAAIPSWQNTTANLLAFTGVVVVGVMVGLSVLLPMAVSALFMLMGLVFVLTFRHAMVFILAIISPLAFVAYMLPNTEGMFKTWFKLFRVLLYIYPAVGFIMGASVIAASVMFSVSQTIEDNAIARWTMMAIATAMPAMGIFAALMLAKTMGSVASKLGINNPLAPAINAAKGKAGSIGKGIDDTTKNSFKSATLGYANKHRGSKSRFRKASVLAAGAAGGGIGGYLKSRAATTKSNYETAQTVYDEEGGFAGKLTEQQQQQRENRIIASATQKGSEHGDSLELANKTDEDLDKMSMGSAETLKALKQQRHGAMMSVADSMHSDLSNDEVSKIASSGYLDLANKEKASRAQVAAAQIRIMKTGSFQERHDALSYMAAHKDDFSEEVRNTVAQEAIKRGDNNIYGPAFGNEIVKQHGLIKGTDSLKDAAIKNAESGKVTPEHMVQNGASTNYIIESVMNSGNTDAINNVKAAADSARTSSITAGRVSEEFDKAFQKIGSFGGGASAPQSSQPPSAPATATNPTPTSNSSGSLTINQHVGAPVTNPAPGSPSNPNGGNTNNTP